MQTKIKRRHVNHAFRHTNENSKDRLRQPRGHLRSLIPNMSKFAKGVTKVFPVFLVIFALLVFPAYYGYDKTNDEVYYDMGQCLPEDTDTTS